MNVIRILQDKIGSFCTERDWEKYHTPGELARAIMVEAGELNELYLWGSDWRHDGNVEDELADVLIYALRLADVLDIDVVDAIMHKIAKNNKKYPRNEQLLVNVRFGALPVGAEFFNESDEHIYAWSLPLVKVAPVHAGCNAVRGDIPFKYDDDTIVQVEPPD